MSDDTMKLARAERADLADFLATLSPEQWLAPTLCEGWRVRDVVAHVIGYDPLGPAKIASTFARGGFLPSRVNEVEVRDLADRTPEQLLALVREHERPRGLTAGFGGMIGLVDGLIHHQDIRRPLGLPRKVPTERLLRALPFGRVAPPVGAFWRARGLRLVATDLDYASGRGPEVRGPAEALLMSIAGRGVAVTELSGTGQAILARRLGR